MAFEQERHIPTKLPTGVQEFHDWAESFVTIYGDALPTQHLDSLKFALASQIMHLGPDDAFKPKEDFFNALIAGAAKQVAHHIFSDIKTRQQEAIRVAEQEAKANESLQQS